MNKNYKFPSFSTISGSGPNSAIIHYKASILNQIELLKKGDLIFGRLWRDNILLEQLM